MKRIPLATEELSDVAPAETNDQESAGHAETWSVATAQKKIAGLTRIKLQTAVSKGLMPIPTFVKPDNSSDDWRQADTLDWLAEQPASAELRYCENCGSRVFGTPEQLRKKFRCPERRTTTTFVDYLQIAPPPIPDVPVQPWGKYDFGLSTFSGVESVGADARGHTILIRETSETQHFHMVFEICPAKDGVSPVRFPAEHLRDPRRFIVRFDEISGDAEEQPKKKKVFSYQITEQEGDAAIATDQDGNRVGLLRTQIGWLINDPWLSVPVQGAAVGDKAADR